MPFKRDLHFRVSVKEYQALSALADIWDEPIASVLRRLVREASSRERLLDARLSGTDRSTKSPHRRSDE